MHQNNNVNEQFSTSTSAVQVTADQAANGLANYIITPETRASTDQFAENSSTAPTVLIHNPIPLQFIPVSYGSEISTQIVQNYSTDTVQSQQPMTIFQTGGQPTSTGFQFLELPQFTLSERQTAFHVPHQQTAVSSSCNPTITNPQMVYPSATINTLDSVNIVHEFLPQMSVFLPTSSSTTNLTRNPPQSLKTPHSPPVTVPKSNGRGKSGKPKEIGVEKQESPRPKKKFISPFAPEATVPLPSQLDELGNMGTTVWRRNERERFRVRCVNEGYTKLRNHLPLTEHEKRLSKVDTLRLAILYIRHLELLCVNIHHELECQCFVNFSADGSGSS